MKKKGEGGKEGVICILESQYAQEGKTGYSCSEERESEMMESGFKTVQATSVCAEQASGGDT